MSQTYPPSQPDDDQPKDDNSSGYGSNSPDYGSTPAGYPSAPPSGYGTGPTAGYQGGYPASGGYGSPQGLKPDNYLVWSILATILCCLPAGIVSIVYSSKVDGLWASGDGDGARRASESAKKWAIASAIITAVLAILYFLFVVVLGVASVDTNYEYSTGV